MLVGLVASGCGTDDAILEVEMDLPQSSPTPERPFAVVQVRDGVDWPFDADWGSDAIDFDLREDACGEVDAASRPCNVRFSVRGSENLSRLHLKIRLCRDESCLAFEDADAPELRYALDRPFYRGEITRWTPHLEPFVSVPAELPTSTSPTIEVPTCEVAGCLEGDPPLGELGWCEEVDGELIHFCER